VFLLAGLPYSGEVLSLAPHYARLEINKDQDFTEVSESIRALLQLCRLNGYRAAVVVSDQEPFDWRSSLRVSIRFSASRAPMPQMKLALVTRHNNAGVVNDVCAVAREAGLECEVFWNEAEAIAWVA